MSGLLSILKSSQKPFVLNFKALSDVSHLFSASHSNATIVNSSGDIVAATSGNPRLTHQYDVSSGLWKPQGILFEASKTNLTLQSEGFQNAYWVKTNATMTDANTLTATATSGYHSLWTSGISFTSGTKYSLFMDVEAGTHSNVQLFMPLAAFGALAYANFDLSSGTVGTVGASINVYSIRKISSTKYRISISATATMTASGSAGIVFIQTITSARLEVWTPLGTETIKTYRSQVEASPISTSYIPTTSSTVTRGADDVTSVASIFTKLRQSSTKPFSIKLSGYIKDSSTNNQCFAAITASGSSAQKVDVINSASNQIQQRQKNSTTDCFNTISSIDISSRFTAVFSCDQNYCALAVNGSSIARDTATNYPTGLNQIQFGFVSGVTSMVSGCIENMTIWPNRVLSENKIVFESLK